MVNISVPLGTEAQPTFYPSYRPHSGPSPSILLRTSCALVEHAPLIQQTIDPCDPRSHMTFISMEDSPSGVSHYDYTIIFATYIRHIAWLLPKTSRPQVKGAISSPRVNRENVVWPPLESRSCLGCVPSQAQQHLPSPTLNKGQVSALLGVCDARTINRFTKCPQAHLGGLGGSEAGEIKFINFVSTVDPPFQFSTYVLFLP